MKHNSVPLVVFVILSLFCVILLSGFLPAQGGTQPATGEVSGARVNYALADPGRPLSVDRQEIFAQIAEPLKLLAVILFVSFLVERIVEFLVGTLCRLIVGFVPQWADTLDPPPDIKSPFRTALIQIFAVGLGLIPAFLYQFDVVYLLSQYLGETSIAVTWYGTALTGVVIGMGSIFVHEIRGFFKPPEMLEAITEETATVEKTARSWG